MSTKKGPQGQAVLSSLSELTLLSSKLIENINLLGGRKLSILIKENLEHLDILLATSDSLTGNKDLSVASWWAGLFPLKSKSLRKLSFFSDKEGKTRIIGILDYWSQSCLRPLHIRVNSILKKIPMDCTFNQNHFSTYLPQIRLRNNHYSSIDLTAATDRMPIALQKRVVEFLYGSAEKANAWEEILVGLPFNISGKTDSVKYGTGQPMGAYSSWPIMALTHHIIVQVAAQRHGLSGSRLRPVFESYSLLGDDLVIAHDLVAGEYRNLLFSLDMPFSFEKTHVSKHTFEFAKRWFHRGSEVTGFSIGGLLSVWKSYPLLLNFLQNQSSHGWTIPLERHPGLILALHKVFHGDKFIYERSHRMTKLYVVFN
jgi:hypothetical protein